jgi:4-amino-4-deoxy-L-arabinose transferase-like glycosyltransferase
MWAFLKKEDGPRAALPAAVIALTTVFLIDMGKEGVLDPFLMLFTTTALVCGYYAFQRRGRKALGLWCLCYGCTGLATLTKGPVGILVPGLVLLTYGLINRKRVHGGGLAHLAGAGVYVLCVGAWLLPAAVAGGEGYARIILIKQNLGRAVGSWSHENPFYYYLIEAPWRLLPWSLLLPVAAVSAFRRWRRQRDDLSLFGLLWLVVPVVFFSLMSGKRGRYILPTVPALGLLCARYMSATLKDGLRFPRAEKWLMRAGIGLVGLGAGVLLAGVVGTAFIPKVGQMAVDHGGRSVAELLAVLTPPMAVLALFVAAVPVLVAVVGLSLSRGSPRRLAAATVASVLALSLALDLTVIPFFNPVKSGKKFGSNVRLWAGDSATVYLFGDEYSGMYNLYAGYTRMPVLETADELRAALAENQTYVVGDLDYLGKALTAEDVQRFAVYSERVGHRKMLLLTGGRSPDPYTRQHTRPFRVAQGKRHGF